MSDGVEGESGEADLALLIHYVAAIDGIDRIRFTTSHPLEFSDNLIQAFADVPELVSFVHLPVQSGSDRVLAAMKRGHTALEYKRIIRKLREVRPDIAISSDFIVGFPGETNQDFEATMQLIDDVDFDQSFSFIYSARPGTPAAGLPDSTSLQIKKQRLARLQQDIAARAQRFSEAMIGSVQSVLVEGPSKRNDGQISGRTQNNRVVNFDGPDTLIGGFVDVLITDVFTHSLQGQISAGVDNTRERQSA